MNNKIDNGFIYRIPVIVPDFTLAHSYWGFGVSLDANLAFKARETKMRDDLAKRFQKEAHTIIKAHSLKGKGLESSTPYVFWDDTALLRSVSVSGNAADLGLEDLSMFSERNFGEYKKLLGKGLTPINYTQHNVDTKDQAYCLLFLWLHWANALPYLDNFS